MKHIKKFAELNENISDLANDKAISSWIEANKAKQQYYKLKISEPVELTLSETQLATFEIVLKKNNAKFTTSKVNAN